jgi:hypothetical protein
VWLLDWEDRREDVENMIHVILRFSDRESPDRDPRSIERADIFTWLHSQVIIDHSLNNSEKCLLVESCFYSLFLKDFPCISRSECPSMCPLHSRQSILMRGIPRGTLVERHHDISSEGILHRHDRLRRKEMFRTITMGTKVDSIFRNRYQFLWAIPISLFDLCSERKYLKSSWISQNRYIIGHKCMQSSEFPHRLVSGREIEVIGIREDDLGSDRTDHLSRHPLHCRLCPDRHEGGSMDYPMCRMDDSGSGSTVDRIEWKREMFHSEIEQKVGRSISDFFRMEEEIGEKYSSNWLPRNLKLLASSVTLDSSRLIMCTSNTTVVIILRISRTWIWN